MHGDAAIAGGTFRNAGSFVKSQGTGMPSVGSWVNTSTGTIDIEAGGLFVNQQAPFANDGTVIIAAHSTLQVRNNYTQSMTGTLAVQLAGSNPDQFSHVSVDSATLGGTLSVSLVGPFRPNPGPPPDRFQILRFNSRPGSTDFDSYVGLDLGGGLRLEPQYDQDGHGLTPVTVQGPSPSPPPSNPPGGDRAPRQAEPGASGAVQSPPAGALSDRYFALLGSEPGETAGVEPRHFFGAGHREVISDMIDWLLVSASAETPSLVPSLFT